MEVERADNEGRGMLCSNLCVCEEEEGGGVRLPLEIGLQSAKLTTGPRPEASTLNAGPVVFVSSTGPVGQ